MVFRCSASKQGRYPPIRTVFIPYAAAIDFLTDFHDRSGLGLNSQADDLQGAADRAGDHGAVLEAWRSVGAQEFDAVGFMHG